EWPPWPVSGRLPSVDVPCADEPPIEQEMSPEDLIREESGEPIFAVDQPPHPVGQPLQPQVAASPDERIEPLLPAAPGRLELLAVMGFWCWLAGAGVMAIVQLIRILRFRRLLAHRMPAPRWLRLQVEELAHRLGVRPPNVLVLPGIGSPMLWSVGRPTLLWPKALLEQLPPGSRPAVLVHELAHLRRRGPWVGWLELVAACVWWWNPLFWHVRRQLHENAELACDAWVVWTLPDDRRAYAEALIEVAQVLSRAVPAPALAIGGGPRQAF